MHTIQERSSSTTYACRWRFANNWGYPHRLIPFLPFREQRDGMFAMPNGGMVGSCILLHNGYCELQIMFETKDYKRQSRFWWVAPSGETTEERLSTDFYILRHGLFCKIVYPYIRNIRLSAPNYAFDIFLEPTILRLVAVEWTGLVHFESCSHMAIATTLGPCHAESISILFDFNDDIIVCRIIFSIRHSIWTFKCFRCVISFPAGCRFYVRIHVMLLLNSIAKFVVVDWPSDWIVKQGTRTKIMCLQRCVTSLRTRIFFMFQWEWP